MQRMICNLNRSLCLPYELVVDKLKSKFSKKHDLKQYECRQCLITRHPT